MKLPPIEWMEKVIRINSITDLSNEELVRFLYPLLKESGLQITEQKVMENGTEFKNLIAFNQSPDAPDLLVLNTHLDTVSYGSKEDWTKTGGDPFRFTRVRDRVYGLGTADVKLDILCKIWAARHAKPWGRPFAIVGTFGEERALNGAQALLTSKKVTPKFALVGEPSNLELIYAHKGHVILTFSIPFAPPKGGERTQKSWRGKSAHSATPDLGENAIVKALTDIRKRGYALAQLEGGSGSNKIPDRCEATMLAGPSEGTNRVFRILEKLDDIGRELRKRRDTRFSPPITTQSLNLVRTEGESLHFTMDLRTLPDVDMEKLVGRLTRAVESEKGKIVSVVLDPPLKGNRNGRFIQAAEKALKAAGIAPVKKTKATSTEASLYNLHGAEAIVFGPGISTGNVHRPNEHNSLRQMQIATRFYANMIQTPAGEL